MTLLSLRATPRHHPERTGAGNANPGSLPLGGKMRLVRIGLCVVALAACEQGASDERPSEESTSKPAERAAAAQKPTATVTAAAEAAVTATPDSATGAAVAPGARSAVPKLDEWNAVTKEVAVRGSSRLHCETKMVREWLRVSCRGKNDTGGTPQTISVAKGGGRGDDFAFSRSGEVTSLVVRFVEGVDLEARFTWSDSAYRLRVWWPRGAPEPPAKGEFFAQ